MTNVHIDFHVFSNNDPKTLIVADASEWAYIEKEPAILEIQLPGESKTILWYLEKNKINLFNSHTLGIACNSCGDDEYLDLPDGIYNITIKGSPDKFRLTKQFLKIDKTQRELDEIIIGLNLDCNDFSRDVLDTLQKINVFLQASESNTRLGQNKEAQKLLFMAQEMIKRLKGCRPCI